MTVRKCSTQKERILLLLTPTEKQAKRTLTQSQARFFGIKSMSSRVRELRDDGYPIKSQPFIRRSDGRTVVRYVLAT